MPDLEKMPGRVNAVLAAFAVLGPLALILFATGHIIFGGVLLFFLYTIGIAVLLGLKIMAENMNEAVNTAQGMMAGVDFQQMMQSVNQMLQATNPPRR